MRIYAADSIHQKVKLRRRSEIGIVRRLRTRTDGWLAGVLLD